MGGDEVRALLRRLVAERRGTSAEVVQVEPETEQIDWAAVLREFSREELVSYGIAVP